MAHRGVIHSLQGHIHRVIQNLGQVLLPLITEAQLQHVLQVQAPLQRGQQAAALTADQVAVAQQEAAALTADQVAAAQQEAAALTADQAVAQVVLQEVP